MCSYCRFRFGLFTPLGGIASSLAHPASPKCRDGESSARRRARTGKPSREVLVSRKAPTIHVSPDARSLIADVLTRSERARCVRVRVAPG
jgi:hypothetical protein